MKGGSYHNKETIRLLQKEQTKLLLKDELYWRQRSRSDWLAASDHNSHYFHNKTSNRRRKSSIERTKDSDNNWVSGDEAIASVVEEYFSDILTSNNPSLGEMDCY